MKHIYPIITSIALAVCCGADAPAQSAIYACGHIRRNRTEAIDNLRNSGFSTAILFNVTVEEDGSLVTDYNWSTQKPDEAGGIICKDGVYTFADYQPHYVDDIRKLLEPPTSIDRIEICIGGWGNGSYGKIKNLIEQQGTGEESILYRNFKALKEVLPEIVAVNNDQEQDYDVATAIAFHKMMYELGYKTTIAPYTQRTFWQQLVAGLNADEQICDLVYLQTYGGGASNVPSNWNVFGGIPMYVGYDCESSSNLRQMKNSFERWKSAGGVCGGFLWNYNSEARVLSEWAQAIDLIFPRTVDDPAIWVSTGEGAEETALPVGDFTLPQFPLYGLTKDSFSMIRLADGCSATVFHGSNFDSGSMEITTSGVLPSDWAQNIGSIRIERAGSSEIQGVEEDAVLRTFVSEEGITITAAGAADVEIFSISGQNVASAHGVAAPIFIPLAQKGAFIVRCGLDVVKVAK